MTKFLSMPYSEKKRLFTKGSVTCRSKAKDAELDVSWSVNDRRRYGNICMKLIFTGLYN